MKDTITTNTVRDYITQYPLLENRTLARKLHGDYPDIFPTIEKARTVIRYIKGSHGNKSRTIEVNKSFHKKNVPDDYWKKFYNDPYSLPQPLEEITDLKAYKLIDSRNILLLSDLHIPYHDIQAIVCALKYGEYRKVDTVILNGDLVDFYSISNFVKYPNKVRLRKEVELTNEFLQRLREIFPTQRIIWREGNHEERLLRYLLRNAPEIFDLDILQFDEIFDLIENRITYLQGKRSIKAGKLNVIHGHEFRGGSGVNPARLLFLRAKCNCICGHFHQGSEHPEKNMNGELIDCWSTGCLCKLNAEYLPEEFNKWNHGFAIVEVDRDELFAVDNKKIINGEIR